MEYQIVEATRWLQSTFFDTFFKVVSWFGTDVFFLIVFTILYWAYKREYALKFGLFYLVSYGVNGLLKVAVNRTRPNGEEHSFPSGHSQKYAVQASFIASSVFESKSVTKSKKVLLLCELIIGWLVIAYARMYLNFHFLTDVLAGLFIGILIVMVGNYLWEKLPAKLKTLKVKHWLMFAVMLVCVAIVVWMSITAKMISSQSYLELYEFAGAVFGVCAGDMLNDRFVKYDPSVDDKSAKIVKCLVGFAFIALVYYLIIIKLASKLAYLMPISMALIMFVATFVLPLIFKKWSNEDKRIEKLENKKKDK